MPEQIATVKAIIVPLPSGSTQREVETIIVGTSPVQLLPNDPGRLQYTIQNLSNNLLYFSPTPDVSATDGFVLVNNFGLVSSTRTVDGDQTGDPVYAVATGAASHIRVQTIRNLNNII